MNRPDKWCGPARPALSMIVAMVALVFAPAAFAAPGAEIVLLVGKGERRQSEQTVWVNAAVNDRVLPGGSVRTLANSQMAVVMTDRTQIRLNQNSQLQIKSLAEATQWSETTVRLNAGRAWSQARPLAAPPSASDAQRAAAPLKMETPTATIGVRGTDWEVEVEPDGRTRVVVLSGVVDVGNESGAVSVGPGEAALAEAGKAPVKYVLLNPQSRVQWVSSWRPQPRHWAGDGAARVQDAVTLIESGRFDEARALLAPRAAGDVAAARVLADLLVYLGEPARAREVLAPHAGDALAVALQAHALAQEDRADEALALVRAAIAAHPRSVDLRIAAGDLARLQGDAAAARSAYLAALDIDPRNVDAWYGLGVIASERERVAQARHDLGEVLKQDPADARALAELAATESFAGNLAQARELLVRALERDPSNYQAHTALGVVLIRSGRTREGLDELLKAGVIEPRYARAWLYTGVAFYQLGEHDRALQAFAHAAKLDPNDPIPYVYRGLVENDDLDPGAAIASAREAARRIPFLRSLNPVASNQKGSGNLGASLASFGLEEWAGYYASRAYSPYWGGSHLFLADRYTGKFNRNSELFQGFLTEPTTFGASNRINTLVTAPGHYAKVEALAERTNWDQLAALATFNGLSVDPFPIAYFASGDIASAQSRDDDSTGRAHNFTLGLGMKPHYQLGVFAFATDTRLRGSLRSSSLPADALDQQERRVDVGFGYRLQPDNQFWFKAGGGSQENAVGGTIVSQRLADSLNRIFSTNIFAPTGTLDAFHSRVEQHDVQLRHAFTWRDVQLTWGAERSRQSNDGSLATTFAPARIDTGQQLSIHSTDAYASARFKPASSVESQLDLFAQEARLHRIDTSTLTLQLVPPSAYPLVNDTGDRRFREWNPRAALAWELAPLQTVRIAVQRWRKPASVSTLAPVDTLGIAVNDRLVASGGHYERARLQFDGEAGPGFFRAYADHESVDNGLAGRRTAISDFQLTQLENLRARPDIFTAKDDLEATPQFVSGRVNGFGLAYNQLVTRRFSIAARWLHRDAVQTGALDGLRIPFVPRDFVQIDAQWASGGQWLFGAGATWRSLRFRDDTNLDAIRAGWGFDLSAYWESLDRRSTVQALLGNLLPNRAAGKDPDPQVTLRFSYRF